MIRLMTIEDYPRLIDLWKSTPNMGLRSLDDSQEGILLFLIEISKRTLLRLKMKN